LRPRPAIFRLSVLIVPLVLMGNDASTDDASAQMVSKYLDASRVQADALRGVEMEVDINATLPKLEKHGTLRALRRISRLGQITYKALGFSGDTTVKKEVISRYLAAESEARESGELAISPANYKFKHKSSTDWNGRRIEVFQITPKKKIVGLFRGELWLDAETGMPVRESGQFVKTPSVFLKKVEFVRDYELQDGVAVPKHIESTVDTRLVGRAQLSIDFSTVTKSENSAENSANYDLASSSGANQ